MGGYYKSPERTSEALDANGFLRTGDLGFRDEDGFFFVTGRLKELIIKGGENIAPRELDEALLLHPAILEAAAVAIPDTDYGQEILAGIVFKAGALLSEEELRAHCLTSPRPLQDAEILHLPARAAEGPLRESAEARDCRSLDEAGLRQEAQRARTHESVIPGRRRPLAPYRLFCNASTNFPAAAATSPADMPGLKRAEPMPKPSAPASR